MKSFIKSIAASFLALILFIVLIIGVVAVKVTQKSDIKDHSFLLLELSGEVLEYQPPVGLMGAVTGEEIETLQRLLENLEKAAVDNRIDGIIVRLSSGSSMGMGMMQETREAFQTVRASGKPIYCYAHQMDRRSYYLASACDSIFISPPCYFDFTGIAAASTHLKQLLKKLGISPNLHQIKEYKSAAEAVTREDMSAEAEENITWLLEDYWDQFTAALEEDRGFSPDEIEAYMSHALFTSREAEAAGLADGILYWDELEARLLAGDEEELRIVTSCRYAEVSRKKMDLEGKAEIAVIHAEGSLFGPKSTIDPLFGMIIGYETIGREFRQLRKDDDIKAIVFRINSSGGEAVTSDLILREMSRTAAVKPVVVSMVDVAASGGYHVAYHGTKMLANPMSITGSIGSITFKFNISDFHEKLGITHDFVTKGPMALLYSPYHDLSGKERERFEANHWDGYNEWIKDIAVQRNMTVEEVDVLARGRVWTGRQAVANRLIDGIGGFTRAVEVAKELADIPAEDMVKLSHYPREKDLLDMLSGEDTDPTAMIRWMLYRFMRDNLSKTQKMAEHYSMVESSLPALN